MSDLDDLAEVVLPGGPGVASQPESSSSNAKKVKAAREEAKSMHGFTHLTGCRKATIKLTEIGPRLTLKLIKVSTTDSYI